MWCVRPVMLAQVVAIVMSVIITVQGQVAPVLMNATATSTTIDLNWTQSGSSVDNYTVFYNYTIRRCGSGPVSGSEEISNGNARSFTLTDLEEDSDYIITLTAISPAGQLTSNQITITTDTTDTSGSPDSVSFGTVTLTSITVEWTEVPCSDRNGEITGYTVEYSSTTPPTTNTMSGSSSRELVVGGLLPRTNYTFTVRAEGSPRSTSATTFTSTPTELGFFLNGTFLSNNSIVLLSDIGEGSNALFCLTNRTQCCTTEAGSNKGGWRFPNDTSVFLNDANYHFYRIRGYSSVSLNRRSEALGPTGTFTCRIPNSQSEVNTNLFIRVSNDVNEAIDITGNRIFQLGETTAITCSTSVPVQSIQWLDESNSVVREGTSVQELALHITIVASHSNTEYTCRVSFHGGLTASDNITISTIAPSISVAVTGSGDGAIAGQSYTLECGVSGAEVLVDVSITYQWTRGSSSVVLGGDMTYTFTPTAGDDGVMYRCAATVTSSSLNATITSSGSRTISVLVAPVFMDATATSTTIALSWTQSGSSVDSYTVSYTYAIRRCGSGPVSGREEISDGNARSFILTDLEEDSDYTISLTAISAAGQLNSNQISTTTATAAPSGSPESISFGTATLTSITVQWTEVPCSDRNGEITGYTVEYSSTTPPTTNTMSGSSSRELVVGGLLPRTNYTFTVRAEGGPRSTSAITFTSTPTELAFFVNGTFLSNNSIVFLSDIGEGSNALFCLTDRTQCCTTEAGGARGSWRFPNISIVTRDDADLSFYAIRGFSSIRLNRRSDAVVPTGIFICRLPDEATGLGMSLLIGVYDDADEAINITGNRVSQLGEATAITCSTPVPVQSIQWLDESNNVVREGTSVQELALNITIAARHSFTEYTCRVSFHGGLTASDTITIRTNGNS